MVFADAHLHSDSIAVYPGLDEAGRLFVCSSRLDDWMRTKRIDDARALRFYGVHPWYADEWGEEAASRLKVELENDPAAGVGEIGLDSAHGGLQGQIPAFKEQLLLADEYRRPIQIHCVHAEKEVLDVLRDVRTPVPAILHSFSNESYVRPFSDLGCYFSVNPRILSRSGSRVSRLLDAIPEDRLLLESDHPYGLGFKGMTAFAEALSEAWSVPASRILQDSYRNAEAIAGFLGSSADREAPPSRALRTHSL